MKRIYKYTSLCLASLVAAGLTWSCDTSKNNDYVQEYDGEPGIYFSTSANSYLELDPQTSTIVYKAYRDVAGAEVTVPLYVDPMDYYDVPDIYTFPDAVTFPAGSKEGDIVIHYDIAKAIIGEEQQYLLTLDADSTPFSSNSIVITLVNPAQWNLLGTNGKYYDMFFWVDSDHNNGPATVSVYQRADKPNIFRITDPYIDLKDNPENVAYFQFEILEEGSNYLGVQVNMPNLVGYNMFSMGYLSEINADIYLTFPGMFEIFESTEAWVANTVAEYQDNGLPGLVTLSPVYYAPDSGDAYGDPEKPFVYIYFPGYEQTDNTLEISYEGSLTTSDRSEYILIDATLGGDLSVARAAVSSEMTASELIAAIEAGTVDYVTFTQSGTVRIPFQNMPTGNYTVAAVAYNADNVVKNSESISFFYISSSSDYDPNAGWESQGYVQYTDGYVCAMEALSQPIITYWVELQKSETQEGLHRLVNPYGEPYPYNEEGDYNPNIDSYLYFDIADPQKVVVEKSDQTFSWDFGSGQIDKMTYCWSMAGYWRSLATDENRENIEAQIEEKGYFGTYANGKVTFEPDALASYWILLRPTGNEEGLTYSNFALDGKAMEAINFAYPIYLLDAKGNHIAPFCIHMDSLRDNPPAQKPQPSSLAKGYYRVPQSAKMLSMRPVRLPDKKGKGDVKSNKINAKRVKHSR